MYSLPYVHQKLTEIAGSEDVYDTKLIKNKLEERYGDHIYLGAPARRSDVCLRNTADYIINDKWYADRLTRAEAEAERTVSITVKLIFGDIQSAEFDCNYYPSNYIFLNTEKGKVWLPPLLHLFLEKK